MARVTSRRDINEYTQEGVLKKNRLFKQIRCCIFACSKPCSLIICLPHLLIDVTRFPSKNLASCRVTRRIRRIIIISVRAMEGKEEEKEIVFFFSRRTRGARIVRSMEFFVCINEQILCKQDYSFIIRLVVTRFPFNEIFQ